MLIKKVVGNTFVAMVALAMAIGSSVSVSALSQSQLEMFSQNNILFYDPDSVNCDSIEEGAYSGIKTEGLTDQQAGFVDQYYTTAASLAIEYGIPWEAVLSQGIVESASGSSDLAVENNNFFGIGIEGTATETANTYESFEDGFRAYFESIKNTPKYDAYGIFTGDAITDPYLYIDLLVESGYIEEDADAYANQVKGLISAVQQRTKESGWQSSSELAASNPEMIENAALNDRDDDTSTRNARIICTNRTYAGNLVSGGFMTAQEADEEIMAAYRSINPRNYSDAGGAEVLGKWRINDVGSCQSDLENCVAFVQYFLCEYAQICMGLPDGQNVVSTLVRSGKGLVAIDKPEVYSIFSKSKSGYGHTGVVLGIDKERNKIIIGEAHCGQGINMTKATEYDLDKFLSSEYTYASTRGLISFGS